MKKIALFIVLPILIIFNLYFYNSISEINIKKGVLNISGYDMNKNISLSGEWEINENGKKNYLKRSNQFFRFLKNNKNEVEIKAKIILDEKNEQYGLKIPYLKKDSKIYINDREVEYLEKLGEILIVKSKNNIIEIKIISKNPNKIISKINGKIYLGNLSNLLLKDEILLIKELMIPFLLFAIFIFNLIYASITRNKLHFILSILSAFVLLSIFFNGTNNIIFCFCLKNNFLYTILRNIFYYGTCIAFVFYINKLFYNILKNKLTNGFFILSMILLCFSFIFFKYNLLFFKIFNIIFIIILLQFILRFYKIKTRVILKMKYYELSILIFAFIMDKIYFYAFDVNRNYFYYSLFIFIMLNSLLSFIRIHKMTLKKYSVILNNTNRINTSIIQFDNLVEKEKKLANISHEIRTPLNPIISYSKILSEKETDENKRKMLLRIKDSADKVLYIINEVLADKKQNKVINEIEEEEIEIKKIIKEIILEMNVSFEKKLKDIRFVKNIKSIPDIIISDKNKIICIIKNVIQNAFKYTNKGEIYLELRVEDNVLKYIVIDSGIGIESNKKNKIFEEFEQGKKDNAGVGLGLSLVKNYINKLNGWINVESELGKGTKFEIYFPVKRINKTQDGQGENIFNNWKENIEKIPSLKKILYKFVLKLPKLIKEIEKAIESKDIKEILDTSHKLKGTSGTLKMWEINDYANKINEEISQENVDYNKVRTIFLSLKGVTDSLPYEEIEKMDLKEKLRKLNLEKKYNILVADDSMENREVIEILLSEVSAECTLVENGKEALEEIKKQQFDIVFLDIEMPIMDGKKAIVEIRKIEKNKDLFVVALTAHDLSVENNYFSNIGFSHYLSKPIKEEELYKLLYDTLEVYRNE